MSYTISDMIDFLDDIYPGWRPKLRRMSYNQVYAIYARITKKQKEAQLRKIYELEYKHWLEQEVKKQHAASYVCIDCECVFVADNPELQECQLCGSHNIRRNVYGN